MITSVEKMNHVNAALKVIHAWKETSTVLVSPQMLDQLEATVSSNVKSQLETWRSNGIAVYLDNAYTNLHTVLEVTRGWPPTKDKYGRALTATMKQVARVTRGSGITAAIG